MKPAQFKTPHVLRISNGLPTFVHSGSTTRNFRFSNELITLYLNKALSNTRISRIFLVSAFLHDEAQVSRLREHKEENSENVHGNFDF